jgi:hypothetical protein
LSPYPGARPATCRNVAGNDLTVVSPALPPLIHDALSGSVALHYMMMATVRLLYVCLIRVQVGADLIAVLV